MLKKRFPIIYRLCILQLLIWGLAIHQSSLIFLGLINLLFLYFLFPEVKNWITTQTESFFVDRLHITKDTYQGIGEKIYYIFQHYILTITIIYFLVGAFDYLFANILRLNMWGAIFVLVLSVLILREDILNGELWLAERKLKKSDIVLLLSIVISVCLMIFWHTSPFYESYFYSLLVGWLCWIFLMIILQFTDRTKIIKKDIFWIGGGLVAIFFLVWIRNTFPSIQRSLTRDVVIYQRKYIYTNCPSNNIGENQILSGDESLLNK